MEEILRENPTQFEDASFSANESKGGCQFRGFKLRFFKVYNVREIEKDCIMEKVMCSICG